MNRPSNRLAFALLTAATILLISGCAQVEVYTDSKLNRDSKTGIPFYSPKPYLLVVRTGAKDKPIEASVIYLPNIAQPLYAKLSPGIWGSSDLSVSFANGILTSVNQKVQPLPSELVTAFAGMPAQLAGAAKTRKETDLLGQESAADYAAVATQLAKVKTDLDAQLKVISVKNFMTTTERDVLGAASKAMEQVASNLRDPTKAESTLGASIALLAMVAKSWDGQVRAASSSQTGDEPEVRRQLAALRSQMQEVIDELSPKKAAEPTITLYEIRITPHGTELIEVKL